MRSADGEKLGKVVLCDAEAFVIEKGILFPREKAIRYQDVRQVTDGELWLSWTKDEIEAGAGDGAAQAGWRSTPGGTQGREEKTIPLTEEELSAQKRMAETGEVEIEKDVVTEYKTIDVPITREEVHVEKVPVEARPASGAEISSSTITVPIKEEVAEIQKRPVVREELHVTKSAETDTQRLTEETKREVADVKTRGKAKRVDKHPPR